MVAQHRSPIEIGAAKLQKSRFDEISIPLELAPP